MLPNLCRSITTAGVLAAVLVLGLPASAVADADGAAAPSGSVAQVNGVPISTAAFERALRQSLAAGSRDTPELRTVLKSRLVAREVLRQEAAKHEPNRGSMVQSAAEEARDDAMIQRYLRQAIAPAAVTDQEVRRQYDAIVATLGEQEYKPRIIQAADHAAAETVLARLKAGAASFETLARQASTAPSAARGGELGWVSFKLPPAEGHTQGLPLPLAQALAKLKPGMVAARPIVWNNRWYVLRLDAVRPTQVPPFDRVKAALRQKLEQQAIERAAAALVAGLLQEAKIEQ